MKNNIKKIITASILTTLSVTAVGCSTNNFKLAKNIDKSMSNFVSSINNLDYVETAKAADKSNNKYGKIVETAAMENDSKKIKILNSKNGTVQFLNNNIDEVEIENTITRPVERSDNFKLYVLSDSPFVSLTSDDNSMSLGMTIKFSTGKIEQTSNEIEEKINKLILKRSILMIYVNEIYNGNVTFSEENKVAINAYVNVIKENTSYLNGNRGMVKNQLGLASDLASSESNENLVNYYIIKSSEALETRASKLDSAISAIDSIIQIVESSLNETSKFYGTKLNATYDSLLSNFEKITTVNEITKDSTNKDIADSISNTLNFGIEKNNETKEQEITKPENNTSTKAETTENKVVENSLNNNNNINKIIAQIEQSKIKLNTNINTNNLDENKNKSLNSEKNDTDTKDTNLNEQSNKLKSNSNNRRVIINKNNKRYMPIINNRRPIFNNRESEIADDLQRVTPKKILNKNTLSNSPTTNQDLQINNENKVTNTDQQITNSANSNKYNDAKSVTNMNENEKIIMRADRTKDTTKNEEAISSSSNLSNDRFKVISTPTVED